MSRGQEAGGWQSRRQTQTLGNHPKELREHDPEGQEGSPVQNKVQLERLLVLLECFPSHISTKTETSNVTLTSTLM